MVSLLSRREDRLRVGDEAMQHETYSDGNKECKNQNRDNAFNHVVSSGPIQFLYDTSWWWLNVRPGSGGL